mmetsp:Transcript_3241/g.5898  ORF Transcript_3241/g.5898 Transcript_3241/m.5898 type:complete len:90 (+) Transcript_3241:124-393(+)
MTDLDSQAEKRKWRMRARATSSIQAGVEPDDDNLTTIAVNSSLDAGLSFGWIRTVVRDSCRCMLPLYIWQGYWFKLRKESTLQISVLAT